MISDRIDEARQAFIYGFCKGLRDDDQGINTTCSFGDLSQEAMDGIGALLDAYMDSAPGVLMYALADFMGDQLAEEKDVNSAIMAGYVVGEEAMDRAKILDLRENE